MTTNPKPDPPPVCPIEECPCLKEDGTAAGADRLEVDLANGAVEVSKSYVATDQEGNFRLTWFNQWNNGGEPANYYGHVGTNWSIDSFASFSRSSSGDLVFVWSPGRRGKSVWFSQSGEGYTPKYGARQTLTRDGDVYRRRLSTVMVKLEN